MPDFHNPHAEHPSALGHAIIALDRNIERDLNDYNYTAADKSIQVLDDITANLDDLSDVDTRMVLIGILRALAIRHNVTREDTNLPDAAPDEFIAGTPCGHRHRIGNYADGCTYGTHMAQATSAAFMDDHYKATHHALTADQVLWPLDEINNPQSLRDFIAGAHSGFEAHLRTLGLF
jgi:hypothetical protein